MTQSKRLIFPTKRRVYVKKCHKGLSVETKTCPVCHKSFDTPWTFQIYCSNKCSLRRSYDRQKQKRLMAKRKQAETAPPDP